MTLSEMIRLMANNEFDAKAFEQSETFHSVCRLQECLRQNPDEGSEEVLRYWIERGLKKELHNTEKAGYKWASYLPVSALERGAATKKLYPLLFVLHGAGNPIYLAESYGYTHIAAREELIVIIPENESAESIDALFSYAKEHYPIDLSRIYIAGYSLGGIMTSRHAIRWPERFAAAGVGGMLFASGSIGTFWHLGIPWPGETYTEEMLAHAAQIRIPVCQCIGEQEFLNLLPLCSNRPAAQSRDQTVPKDGHPAPQIDLSSKGKLASVNNWRRIAGCPALTEEQIRKAVQNTADIVTEKLGFPFEHTEVRKLENRSHYIGDCINPDGETLARFICMGKSPHWPSAALAELTWEFMKQFARDASTGKLYFLNTK